MAQRTAAAMDLAEEESYALAALFTLALHSTQYERGNATDAAWGEPPELEANPSVLQSLDDAGLEAFWGYDCVAQPGGLLERAYRTLALPRTKWRGLQALPTVALSSWDPTFRSMVRSLIGVLDAELAAALPPLASTRPASRLHRSSIEEGEGQGNPSSPPESQARRQLPADQMFEGLLNDASDDEDWRADLERERQVQARLEAAGAGRRAASPPEQQQREGRSAAANGGEGNRGLQQDLAADFQRQAGIARSSSADFEQQQPEASQQGSHADVASPSPAAVPQAAVQASRKGVAATLALLQCCVGAVLPEQAACQTLADSEEQREAQRGSPGAGSPEQQQLLQQAVAGPPPRVRWYDARARVALKAVAGWLRISPGQLGTLEMLLTSEKAPASKGYTPAEEDGWSRRMRYLKVGAAAVGGGALFAVTGGLAAPAIAAGLMSILPVIGAPAAVASGVAGLSTAGGLAFTTSAIGTAGAATVGTRMAHRVGNVSEFGFRELRPAEQAPQPSPAQQRSKPASSSASSSGSQLSEQQQQGPGPCSRSSSDGRLAGEGASSGEDADLGHLQPFSMGGRSSNGGARRPARLSSAPPTGNGLGSSSAHSSTGDVPAAGGSDASQQQQQPSAWQRWFGGKDSAAEAKLLPVPIRARPGGDTKLSVVIGVAGWVSRSEEFESTWACLRCPDADVFALVWESRELLALNSALSGLMAQQATGQGVRLAVHSFFYAGAGLVAALSPTVILGTASGLVINNAWQVASDRALKAGKLLAELLESGAHGDRPVSLIGHGMGARLIFSCLLELCRRNCRGVVENAVLLGAPVEATPERWQMARRAAAGRLVNCYSRRDWLLGVCYGGSTGWMRAAAGLVPIESVPGVENVNLTGGVDGHFAYLDFLPEVLHGLGLFCA